MAHEDEDIPRELARRVADYLTEVSLEKREARERAAKHESAQQGASRWSLFWKWLAANTASLSTMVTVVSIMVGASWTLKQYFDQERERIEQRVRESELERRKTIANFAGDLSDLNKRIGATYALAVLAGENAIPLLMQHLIESMGSEKDGAFREALIQALITIGPASLDPVIGLHREQRSVNMSKRVQAQGAAESIILHFLRQQHPALTEARPKLAGITFKSVHFCGENLDGLNLSSVQFVSVDLTVANLDRTILHKASFRDSQLGEASLKGAVLTESQFERTSLWKANLQDANLTGSSLVFTDLHDANLTRAILVNVHFDKVNLEDADLSGADLAGAAFFGTSLGDPNETAYVFDGRGPHVRGANFAGARNIDATVQQYLCREGAVNIPGGCEDREGPEFPKKDKRGIAGSSTSCI
jgi:uncharacterized protein YjbI with pentapeptide repeats